MDLKIMTNKEALIMNITDQSTKFILGVVIVTTTEVALCGSALAAFFLSDGLSRKIYDTLAPEGLRGASSAAPVFISLVMGAVGGVMGCIEATSYSYSMTPALISEYSGFGMVAGGALVGTSFVLGAKVGAGVAAGISFRAAHAVKKYLCPTLPGANY